MAMTIWGKINEDGSFERARMFRKVSNGDRPGFTLVKRTPAMMKEDGFKRVVFSYGTNRPCPGRVRKTWLTDEGDTIVRHMDWVEKEG